MGLNGRRANDQYRLPRKNGGAFRHRPDIAREPEVSEIVQKFLAKEAASPEVCDVFFRKMQVFNIINGLLQSGGDGISAVIRNRAEKKVEIGYPVPNAGFQVSVAHGQLIKVAEHSIIESRMFSHVEPPKKHLLDLN